MGSVIPEGIERIGPNEAGQDDLCRFCFTGPDDELGDLISPCACKVSVHKKICSSAFLLQKLRLR